MEVLRYDIGIVNQVEESEEGFLTVKGVPTRCGVFPYQNSDGSMQYELRHPEDVLRTDSLKTLGTKPVCLEHPRSLVSPRSWGSDAVGISGHRVDVLDGGLIEVVFAIQREDAVETIKAGRKRYLSAGYRCDCAEEAGEYDGTSYTHRQTNIRYNHIALTDNPRAGVGTRLRMDSGDVLDVGMQMDTGLDADADECKWISQFVNTEHNDSVDPLSDTGKEPGRPMATITIDGASYECPEALAGVVSQKLTAQKERMDSLDAEASARFDAADQVEGLVERLDAMTEEKDRQAGIAYGFEVQLEEAKDTIAELSEARTDSGVDEAAIEERVSKEAAIRVDALNNAYQVIAGLKEQGINVEVRFDSGSSPMEIKRSLVTALHPGEDIADDEVPGLYRAASTGKTRTDAVSKFHADMLEGAVNSTEPKSGKGKGSSKKEEASERDQKRMDNCKAPLAMSKGR